MSATTASAPDVPFLEGAAKQLFIAGEWVTPRSGGTMASVNPSTGERIAEVADADAADVDRAVAAARAAFDGSWRTMAPAARERLLLRIAETLEEHYAELKVLTAVDMGTPVGRDPRAGAE